MQNTRFILRSFLAFTGIREAAFWSNVPNHKHGPHEQCNAGQGSPFMKLTTFGVLLRSAAKEEAADEAPSVRRRLSGSQRLNLDGPTDAHRKSKVSFQSPVSHVSRVSDFSLLTPALHCDLPISR